jgi:hypothetical protein
VRPCRAFARILTPVATQGRTVDDAGKLKEEVRRMIAAELPAELAARAAGKGASEGTR